MVGVVTVPFFCATRSVGDNTQPEVGKKYFLFLLNANSCFQ
jgi:hypothetical protein